MAKNWQKRGKKMAEKRQYFADDKEKKMCYTIIVPKWDLRNEDSSEEAFCFDNISEGGMKKGETV